MFSKFSGNVGNGKNYKWFNFGDDPEGILDLDPGILDHFEIVGSICLAEVCALRVLF